MAGTQKQRPARERLMEAGATLFADKGYDGVLEPGMTLCVESFIGREGGKEGVKLEEQVLITETGNVVLSRYPFEDDLLTRVI